MCVYIGLFVCNKEFRTFKNKIKDIKSAYWRSPDTSHTHVVHKFVARQKGMFSWLGFDLLSSCSDMHVANIHD